MCFSSVEFQRMDIMFILNRACKCFVCEYECGYMYLRKQLVLVVACLSGECSVGRKHVGRTVYRNVRAVNYKASLYFRIGCNIKTMCNFSEARGGL